MYSARTPGSDNTALRATCSAQIVFPTPNAPPIISSSPARIPPLRISSRGVKPVGIGRSRSARPFCSRVSTSCMTSASEAGPVPSISSGVSGSLIK